MNYENYSADDLIKDEAFQQWVFSPTEEANRFWLMFLQDHPGHRERVEEARQFLSVFNVRDKDVFESKISNLKKRIDHAIDQPESTAHQPPVETASVVPKRPRRRILVKIAASVSIVFLTAFLIFYYYVYSASHDEQIATASVRMLEEVTPRGKRTMVQFGDGSAWLNADSRLEYPENLKDPRRREVYLEGEAFFKVAGMNDKPFLVNTADLTVRTLGASFNITSYAPEERIEVTLVKGIVTLESKDRKLNQVALASGQKAIFEKRSGKLVLENQVDTARSSAWKNGVLTFDDQPFTEIKTILERWYDVTLHVDDESAARCRFSAVIDNKTLEEGLGLLTPAGTIAFRREGKDLFITGKLCPE
jgi:transmembrane sensor